MATATARIVQQGSLPLGIEASSISYNYNTTRNRLVSAGSVSFGYDDEGQLASGYGTAYTFDDAHRLTAIGTSYGFTYNGAGDRIRVVRNGTETRYVYDASGNLIAEADANNVIQSYYIYGAGLLAMVTASNDLYCYHFDATGNTVALTNGSKAIVNKYAYTPFGTISSSSLENIHQPFTFVGQFGVMTEPGGLYYMKARYYDPNVGRFISEDPIGFDGGDINLHAYVKNNPIMLVDPMGLDILAAIRKADAPLSIFDANHIYLWYTDAAGGRGEGWGTAGSGSSARHNHVETMPAEGMYIKINLDPSQEAAFWKRWKDEGYADQRFYCPYISDCFSRPVSLTAEFGVSLTIPWSRTGQIKPVTSGTSGITITSSGK